MKTAAYIFLLLIVTSVARSATPAWSMVMHRVLSCHAASAVQEAGTDDCAAQKSNNCCAGDEACPCTCCLHIVAMPELPLAAIEIAYIPVFGSLPGYLWSYAFDYSDRSFHPPLV